MPSVVSATGAGTVVARPITTPYPGPPRHRSGVKPRGYWVTPAKAVSMGTASARASVSGHSVIVP